MPEDAVSAQAPTITAAPSYIVTGSGFLPDHNVTVRVTHIGDGVSDYLTYSTDHAGHLFAALPPGVAARTSRIAVTDHRPDPHGACGLLWSNTETLRGDGATA
jgi:hypothetical protein